MRTPLVSTLLRFSNWITLVAEATSSLLNRLACPKTIRLVERDQGTFVIEGATNQSTIANQVAIVDGQISPPLPAALAAEFNRRRVELILHSDRFLFRSISFPSRAGDFLASIVHSQIDRLTPWKSTEAAFGWITTSAETPNGIAITIAASPQSALKPLIEAVTNLKVYSLAVFTKPPGQVAASIRVWDEKGLGIFQFDRLRRALLLLLGFAALLAGISAAGAAFTAWIFEPQQAQLERQIANTRNVTQVHPLAQHLLKERKQSSPSPVLILETLSRILPDHTYVSELHIEANQMRLTGVTQDAPSLIGLIERSGYFTRATFFAPTTRSSSSSEERFHIETTLKSLAASLP